jgi:hypothetical protein
MIDVEGLKQEIDIDGNQEIEVKEMEDFLQSEDNLRKLGEALESNTDSELAKEFRSVI